MRHTAAEKHAIIRLVEGSDLPVRHTLRELQVHRSTFYAWYRRYAAHGQAGPGSDARGGAPLLEPDAATSSRGRCGGRCRRRRSPRRATWPGPRPAWTASGSCIAPGSSVTTGRPTSRPSWRRFWLDATRSNGGHWHSGNGRIYTDTERATGEESPFVNGLNGPDWFDDVQ